jgi:prephenate dehydrogenase
MRLRAGAASAGYAIVTDAGSTKQDVVAAARAALARASADFVPGHPIAGAETEWCGAARADLYQVDKWC